jgi:hypothetical protein
MEGMASIIRYPSIFTKSGAISLLTFLGIRVILIEGVSVFQFNPTFQGIKKEGTQDAEKKIVCFETMVFPLAHIDHSSGLHRYRCVGMFQQRHNPANPRTVNRNNHA